jgi:16S rRNA (adenine1518-N6/adenine1519-N6)-dimethyltransferase
VLADLAARGFRFQPRLGQNFLFDPQLLEAFIDDAAVTAGERVLEVGAGAGTLTERLLARGAEVVAAEIDPILLEHLRARGPHPRLTLVAGDALGAAESLAPALEAALALGDRPFRLVANLPYAIATPLVMRLVARSERLAGIAVLVQTEVAERWVARPGGKEYGAASVLLALAGSGRIARRVSGKLFTPVPRVESAFYVWEPHGGGAENLPELLGFTRSLFQHRRKMVRAILRERLAEGDAAWGRAGVDPRSRPEELPPEAFVALWRELGGESAESHPLR